MAIFKGSRLRHATKGAITDINSNTEIVFGLTETTLDAPVQSAVYKTQAGDTLESIAYREYGDGNKWYVLASVNPEIFWPLDLETGTEILIPPRSFAELM